MSSPTCGEWNFPSLTLKAPNTTIAEFANTVDPDETAHNEPSHLDLQSLPSSLWFFNIIQFYNESFSKFCRRKFVVCFFGALRVNIWMSPFSFLGTSVVKFHFYFIFR